MNKRLIKRELANLKMLFDIAKHKDSASFSGPWPMDFVGGFTLTVFIIERTTIAMKHVRHI